MAKILITGGTGLVGKRLTQHLEQTGHQVAWLTRAPKKKSKVKSFRWSVSKGQIDPEALDHADYVIHLAGAGIADKPWTEARRKLILDSREASAKLLFEAFSQAGKAPRAFITASAVGWYGGQSSLKLFVESDPAEDDFMGRVCQAWEQAADPFASLGARVVKVRVGIVLDKDGGMLQKVKLPFFFGLGSRIGNGRQVIPWVHIDDLCRIFAMAVEDGRMHGAYNATAPASDSNRAFTQKLAKAMRRPCLAPPVPAFAIRLLLGQRSVLLLNGNRVSPHKVMGLGFQFLYPELQDALDSFFRKRKSRFPIGHKP